MILMALFFTVIGIAVKHGKMYYLIAGYNTLPKAKKAKVDIEGVATLFRNVMLTIAAGILIVALLAWLLDNPAVETYGLMFVVVSGALYLVIKSNSKRYRLDSNN